MFMSLLVITPGAFMYGGQKKAIANQFTANCVQDIFKLIFNL